MPYYLMRFDAYIKFPETVKPDMLDAEDVKPISDGMADKIMEVFGDDSFYGISVIIGEDFNTMLLEVSDRNCEECDELDTCNLSPARECKKAR